MDPNILKRSMYLVLAAELMYLYSHHYCLYIYSWTKTRNWSWNE